MSASEQAEAVSTGDQGSAFDSLGSAGEALTSVLDLTNEEQPLEEATELPNDEELDVEPQDQDDETDGDVDEDTSEDDEEDDFDDLDLEDESDEVGEDQLYKVGDEEVSLKQLQEGYMRTADYTKKTEAVAQERKLIEADRKIYAEASQQTKAIYDAMVNFVQTNLIHPMPDQALANSNPQLYNEELALHYRTTQEAKNVFDAAQVANQTLGTQQQQISEIQLQRQRDAEFSKLQESYPALKDPSKLMKFETSVNEFAKEIGFSDQDIASQAPDARVMKLLHLAKIGQKALNDRRSSKQKIGEKAIGKRTNRVSKKGYRDTRDRQAVKRLAQSGSVQDAGAVLANMLLKPN